MKCTICKKTIKKNEKVGVYINDEPICNICMSKKCLELKEIENKNKKTFMNKTLHALGMV